LLVTAQFFSELLIKLRTLLVMMFILLKLTHDHQSTLSSFSLQN